MASQLVVIVNDSVTNLKILERLALSLDGQTVVESFTEPGAALDFCSTRPPDLLLLAATTAAGGAATSVAQLHDLPECAGVPVIVVGSDADLDAIEQARASGAVDHLLIPLDPSEFRIRAHAQLRRRRALPEEREDETGEATADRAGGPSGQPFPAGARHAYETLLRLIDVIPRMICVTARDGRYLLVNRMFASFVGAPASRLIGKRPAEAQIGRAHV